ncbi:hypothetical protein D3C71_1476230 [compost metagenome]
MALVHVARHLRHVDGVESLLVRLAKIHAHFLDAGGDHQHVGRNFTCQQRGGEIFINHRVDALIIPFSGADHRNSAAARADHHKAFLRQGFDGIGFDNAHRLRRGDHATVSAPGIFDKVPVGMSEL